MTVAGTYATSYEYHIATTRNTVNLGNFNSNECDSKVEFFADSVLLTSPNSFFGYTSYADSGRSFTLTAPYTDKGITVNGATDIWWETSDYALAGTYTIKMRFYTVKFYSDESSTYTQTTTFTLTLIDPRCAPNLVLPSLTTTTYTHYINYAATGIDLTGALNGNCQFILLATANTYTIDSNEMKDDTTNAWMTLSTLSFVATDSNFPEKF